MILLPTSPRPRVSILIVTASQADLLARCLETLAGSDTAVPYEVIVVLNEATSAVTALVHEHVAGVTVLSSSTPLGLAGGLDLARASARGDLLVSLHDDTEVEPGWLDGLVAAADAHPEAGAIGSRVLHLDGTLQTAGAVVWRDGTVHHLTEGNLAQLAPEDATLAVDYCGSASLLVRARTWDAIGGADPRFFPAYYVDADLCLGVWKHGEAVLNTPRSRVRHHRSASTDRRFREFLLRRNHALFCSKWSEALLRHEPPDPGSTEAFRRALALAAERWRRVQPGAAISPADPPPSTPAQSIAPIVPERLLRVAHQLQRAWSEELLRELEHAEATLAAANADLGATTAKLARVEAEGARLRGEAAERERELAEERARAVEERARTAEERARGAEDRRRHALEIAPLRERDRLLATIESGRWWRLYARLLPVLRALRRLSRRGGASRTG